MYFTQPTYKYQGSIEVIVVFLEEVSVVFRGLFAKLFVEVCTRVGFLLRGGCL